MLTHFIFDTSNNINFRSENRLKNCNNTKSRVKPIKHEVVPSSNFDLFLFQRVIATAKCYEFRDALFAKAPIPISHSAAHIHSCDSNSAKKAHTHTPDHIENRRGIEKRRERRENLKNKQLGSRPVLLIDPRAIYKAANIN